MRGGGKKREIERYKLNGTKFLGDSEKILELIVQHRHYS